MAGKLSDMIENARILYILLSKAIRSKMEYQSAFLFMFFAITIFYIGQLGVILVVLSKFGSISGWDISEMALLYSLLVFSQALTSLFFSALLGFEMLIVNGMLDRYLLRPLPLLNNILVNNFEISSVANFSVGSFALYYAISHSNIDFNLAKIFFFILTLIGGTLIQGSIRLMVSTIAFWTKRNRSLVHVVVFSTKEFILYPISIYRHSVQIILTVIFPIAFINYYPSHYFLSKDSSNLLFTPLIQYMTPVVGLILFTASYIFWRIGINHYQSSGH